jgi:hypothetical protein
MSFWWVVAVVGVVFVVAEVVCRIVERRKGGAS